MFHFQSRKEIVKLFQNLYSILVNIDRNLDKPWYKIDKIDFFENYTKNQIDSMIMQFKFLHKESWNHVEIDKTQFILESLEYLEHDISELSLILDYNGFEKLVKKILAINEYIVFKNYRFSDKSDFKRETSQTRYEIDVVGLNRNFLLLIDAKQWNRRDSFSAINKAANLQLRRAKALSKNPYILGNLLKELNRKKEEIKKYLPLKILSLMVTLEESSIKLSNKKIPLVSIYRFNSFLRELSDNSFYFNIIEVDKISVQETLI